MSGKDRAGSRTCTSKSDAILHEGSWYDKIRFSHTLAWLGAVQHAQEKAVTAEGLMRTATDTMKS